MPRRPDQKQQRPLGIHLGENKDTFERRQKALEAIALQQGCMFGDQPSVSKLIKNLADGKLIVVKPQKSEGQ